MHGGRARPSTSPVARSRVELDAVPERRHPGERLDPVGELLDREERAREEEERHEREAEDRDEPLVGVGARADRGEPGGEREPAEQRRERRQHGERRGERPADRRDDDEHARGDDDPDAGPGEHAGDELADAHGRRDDRVVRPSHLSPTLTGNVVTLAAVCIAVAATSAGATNSR